MLSSALITGLRANAFTIPTDRPEADGTFAWSHTTLVVVEIEAAGRRGLGFTYSDPCVTGLVIGPLADSVEGADPLDIAGISSNLWRKVRNLGRSGLCATAISAIDTALWDLKAKLLDLPLCKLLGMQRIEIPLYGSGGFTTYTDRELHDQLSRWATSDGCRFVKMKVGSDPDRDPHRVRVAREAIGRTQLFVDANGAFDTSQALRFAEACEDLDLRWFEEPVTSDDPAGLHLLRGRLPAGMSVAAGEYIYTTDDARRLLEAQAVDVLQADVTRCGGITGFLQVAALCDAHHIDLSAHCAPALHRHVACAASRLRHVEWFHDHVRIEHMLFEGAPHCIDGVMMPDLREAGHGLAFRWRDAEKFLVGGERSR